MKKLLNDYEFENYYNSNILYRGRDYYKEDRILDIWYKGDTVTAYIDGSHIYRVEVEIENDNLARFNCSCPYSDGGERMCKHIAAVLYYLKDNEIPELEGSIDNKKEKNKKSNLDSIYKEMDYELRKISDSHGFINYYNGRYFVDLISQVSSYIDDFIDNEEYSDAFELIKYTYQFIKDTFMDGSNGEYQESLYMINESASKLLYNSEYYIKFLDYTKDITFNDMLGDFSDSPLHAFILFVHDKDSAIKVVKVLDEIETSMYGIFVNPITNKIEITYDYISKDDAIDMCYKYINDYGVEELLIKYLKNDNRIDEVIEILKDDIKNKVRKDIAYDKLLDVYDEYGKKEEKKQLLPEVIIETSSFKRYKELKEMYSKNKWDIIKRNIIFGLENNNSNNNRYILEDIYREEKEIDKLFELIKKNHSLSRLEKYQDALKDKYSEELLEFYRPQIIESARRLSDRSGYHELCVYISKMSELDNSEDYIYEMLKEMYPSYKGKRAFKEEIANVLHGKNKDRFNILIHK